MLTHWVVRGTCAGFFLTALAAGEPSSHQNPGTALVPTPLPVPPAPHATCPPGSSPARAKEATAASPRASTTAPSVVCAIPCATPPREESQRKRRWLEFSFGSAQIFHNQSVYDPGGLLRRRIIPVSSIALFGEWLFHPRFSVVALLSWPIEPQSELVDGEIHLQYVAPSLGGGLRATAFSHRILEETTLELQFAGFAAAVLSTATEDSRFYPLAAWRVHLRDVNGFTLYAGSAFAFVVNTGALIYGVGHRF